MWAGVGMGVRARLCVCVCVCVVSTGTTGGSVRTDLSPIVNQKRMVCCTRVLHAVQLCGDAKVAVGEMSPRLAAPRSVLTPGENCSFLASLDSIAYRTKFSFNYLLKYD